MRKVSLTMQVTLDGYVAGPNGQLDWLFRRMDPALEKWTTEYLHTVDTVLLGRTTYLEQAAAWPQQRTEMAELMNGHTKVVFSTTLDTLAWNNSRLAAADMAAEIADLKHRSGKDIYLSGGPTLVQAITRLGLVDEFHLAIHPTVLGRGKPLFRDHPLDLEHIHTTTYESGIVQHTYRTSR
ncbi:dihydrofolate reductase family protein [Dactylosporangium sp. NPDC049140]|uniref:dihydrofolate reductase family protein n=1 Tax=Dactylosporangium sp. NPDC049140 TaxID=3155647 RepID=UPI0033C17A14